LVWIERQSNSWFRVQFQPSSAINDKLHWFKPIRIEKCVHVCDYTGNYHNGSRNDTKTIPKLPVFRGVTSLHTHWPCRFRAILLENCHFSPWILAILVLVYSLKTPRVVYWESYSSTNPVWTLWILLEFEINFQGHLKSPWKEKSV
jgi:hypothetical protein